MTEVWKEIPGFPGYDVSDMGNVRSWHVRGGRGSGARRAAAPHSLKLCVASTGYLKFAVWTNGAQLSLYVHRIALLTFVGPPLPGQECRHLNGVRSDERLANLCYGTRKENVADKRLHGTDNAGERHYNTKLCDASVLAIRAEYASEGVTKTELAHRYGVSRPTISRIISRYTWRYI